MQSAIYPLDQSSALLISGLLSAGHEESADSLPPMEQDSPRFDYAQIRDRINGYAPPAPRNYAPAYDGEETPDMNDDEGDELESLLRTFARDKQGREYSGDILPSMRTRGAIRSELASMGCAWND